MNPTHTTTALTVITFILGYIGIVSATLLPLLLTFGMVTVLSFCFPKYNHLTPLELYKCLVTTYIFGVIAGYYLHLPEWDIFGIFLCISSVRYYGEFQLINYFHHQQLQWDSYLIYHSKMSFITNIFLLLEHIVTKYVIDAPYKHYHFLMIPALILALAAMVLRIVAFFTAKSNFTHQVSYNKKQNHVLVQHGVYSVFRHPSYTGFFYHTVASMVMIGNFVSATLFGIMLSVFFQDRIAYEQRHLLNFFGEDYWKYMQKTHILIPYLPKAIRKHLPQID